GWVGYVDVKGLGAGLLPGAVARNEPQEGGLDEVVEPAALGSGPAEVAAEQAQGKLLVQFLRRHGVPEGAVQVTGHRPAVAVEQFPPGRRHFRVRPLVGPANKRPAGRKLAQERVGSLFGHVGSRGLKSLAPQREGPSEEDMPVRPPFLPRKTENPSAAPARWWQGPPGNEGTRSNAVEGVAPPRYWLR